MQPDGQVDARRICRLALQIGIYPELGRHTGFEDRHFDGKVAILQKAAIVRPPLIVFRRLSFVTLAVLAGFGL